MTQTAQVTLYSTPTCPYCKMAKEFFQHHDVEFISYNVADDQAKAEEMLHKTSQSGVPVIVIKKADSEDVVVGFDQQKISELLGISA